MEEVIPQAGQLLRERAVHADLDLTSTVTGLQSTWMGTSATEFQGLYDQWKSSMNTMLESLNTMSTRLQSEITEWETMASKLA